MDKTMDKTMTKQRLTQYNNLRREIAMLEEQCRAAETSGEIVGDVVQGSTKQRPFAKRRISIKGYGSQAIPKLEARKAACLAECDAIEIFIYTIDNSLVRQLLVRRFIECMTVKEAAQTIGYSERQVIRIINNFFEEMSKNVEKSSPNVM